MEKVFNEKEEETKHKEQENFPTHFSNQVGGHSFILKQGKWLFKPENKHETQIYENISKLFPKITPFIAEYKGTLEISSKNRNIELKEFIAEKIKDGDGKDGTKAKWAERLYNKYSSVNNIYLQIQDLTFGKKNPAVLDLKLGNVVYKVEKFASMTERINNSTSLELHFRLGGMQAYMSTTKEIIFRDKHWGRSVNKEELKYNLALFFYNGEIIKEEMIKEYQKKLQNLLECIRDSKGLLFSSTSLLFIYDASFEDLDPDSKLNMIDFTHTKFDQEEEDIDSLIGVNNIYDCLQIILDNSQDYLDQFRHGSYLKIEKPNQYQMIRKFKEFIKSQFKEKEHGFREYQRQNSLESMVGLTQYFCVIHIIRIIYYSIQFIMGMNLGILKRILTYIMFALTCIVLRVISIKRAQKYQNSKYVSDIIIMSFILHLIVTNGIAYLLISSESQLFRGLFLMMMTISNFLIMIVLIRYFQYCLYLSLITFFEYLLLFFYFNITTETENIIPMFVLLTSALIMGLVCARVIENEECHNFSLKAKLQRKEKLFRNFLDALNDPVIMFTKKKRIIFQNRASSLAPFSISPENFLIKLEQFKDLESRLSLEEHINKNGDIISQQMIAERDFRYKVPEIKRYKGKQKTGENIRIVCINLFSGAFLQDEEHTYALKIKDVTEKKKLEQAKISEKYTTALLCTLSHELRTPIHGINGSLKLLKHNLKDPKLVDLTKSSLSASFILKNKINDFLDYAQLKAGDFKLHLTNVHLSTFLTKLVRKFEPTIISKKIKLVIEIQPGILPTICLDEVRITQILVNLIENSIKFTKFGEVKISVDYKKGLRFAVKDTGCGMAKGQIKTLGMLPSSEAIFNPGIRKESTNNKASLHVKSSGLCGFGLTVSKLILNELGSKLLIKSKLLKGTVCSFCLGILERRQTLNTIILDDVFDQDGVYNNGLENRGVLNRISTEPDILPIVMEEIDEINIPEEDSELPPILVLDPWKGEMPLKRLHNSSERLHIPLGEGDRSTIPECLSTPKHKTSKNIGFEVVVVDDSVLNRNILSSLLQREGLIVADRAEDGEQAVQNIERYRKHSATPLLVCMDIDMPVMDGIDATRIIRRNKYRHIFIAAVTAYAGEQERENCALVGMNMFLIKPISTRSLKLLIRNATNHFYKSVPYFRSPHSHI